MPIVYHTRADGYGCNPLGRCYCMGHIDLGPDDRISCQWHPSKWLEFCGSDNLFHNVDLYNAIFQNIRLYNIPFQHIRLYNILFNNNRLSNDPEFNRNFGRRSTTK
jgi:hypothetical protein